MSVTNDGWLAERPLTFVHPSAIQRALDTDQGAIVTERCKCTAGYPTFRAGTTWEPFVVMTREELLERVSAAPTFNAARMEINDLCVRRAHEHFNPEV